MENVNKTTEQLRPEDANFIPEAERDEFGNVKKKPYKQQDYEALSDYGG